PAGCELDLSAMGKGTKMQQISFGGKVKLVLEEGAILRLPENPLLDAQGFPQVVLYFNDEAELLFEPARDPSVFLLFTDATNNPESACGNNTAPSKDKRIKIIGKGQIWLNKNAKMVVNGDVFVGVETDRLTQ